VICPDESALEPDPEAIAGFAGVRILATGAPIRGGIERAWGLREATAPIVAYGEDHCFPDPTWAEALLRAHEGPWTAVGPTFRNANPETLVSWADLFIAYGTWMAPSRGGEMSHLPGHNSSYKRAPLLALQEDLGALFDSESVLHWRLVALGHRLWLEPTAQVAHTNFARWRPWLWATWQHGRVFGATRAAPWSGAKRLAFALASPLIPLVRLQRILRDIRRCGVPIGLCLRTLPAMCVALVADGLAQGWGTAFGDGAARENLACAEFKRVDVNAAAA
jgi:hypothetical protein